MLTIIKTLQNLDKDDMTVPLITSSPQAQPDPRRNANTVAHKVLSASFRKLQETGNANNSKSCFMLQRILENLEVFGSDEGGTKNTFIHSIETVL